MAEGTRTEQLAQKVTPAIREKLDDVLKKMGHYDTGKDGHIKWDQEVLEEIIAILEEKMATPDGASDMSLYEQHQKLKQQLDHTVEEWERVSMELEEMNEK